jgi:hypothetical protein
MPDIKHSIQIAAEPEVVYPVAASAKGFGEWWATDIMEPQESRKPLTSAFSIVQQYTGCGSSSRMRYSREHSIPGIRRLS